MRLTKGLRALIGCPIGQLKLGDAQHQMAKQIATMEQLHDTAAAGGGPRGLHRHCVINKKLAPRKRLELLFDNGHYYEVNRLAGYAMPYGHIPAAGSIVGIGTISNRLCIASANDATVKGGTIYPIGVKKTLRMQEISAELRLPVVYLVDSGGAFLPLQSEIFPDSQHGGRTFNNEAKLNASGIAQLALVLGSSTAGGAYVPTMCDEVVMVNSIGHIFLGGPPLVQAALGERVTADELGGAELHSCVSGCSDHLVQSEAEGFQLMRHIAATLPAPHSAAGAAPAGASFSHPAYPPAELDSLPVNLLPRELRQSAIVNIAARLIDNSSLLQFKPLFGDQLLCGFATIHGHQIGIIGSSGTLQEKDAVKGAHFLELCAHRSLSAVLFLCHTEQEGATPLPAEAVKAKARMLALVATCPVPKLCLLVGDASGTDYYLMSGRSQSPTFTLAWPNAKIAKTLADDCDASSSSSRSSDSKLVDAFTAAGNMWVDDVVRPSHTREHLKQLLQFIKYWPSANNDSSSCHNGNGYQSYPVMRM